ncbi:MAG: hypothetical protein FD135_3217 [Comamonadaceae bacterium]|nr:MAG: hypothetical protein FD135_3217 [Comamonadaceae bacterium]
MNTSTHGTPPLLMEQFDTVRTVLQEAGIHALNIPARHAVQRPNALLQMLRDEALCNHAELF